MGPGDNLLRRAAAPPVFRRDSRWRFRNAGESAVVLDAPGHEPTVVEAGREVVFFAAGETLLAVADPERSGVVLETGPVEDLAEPLP